MSSVQSYAMECKCQYCEKTFKTVHSRYNHIRMTHNHKTSKKMSSLICPICPSCSRSPFRRFEPLMKHLTSFHRIKFEIKKLEFENKTSFMEWKKNMEKKTKSSYFLRSTTDTAYGKIFYYKCNRSNIENFKNKCARPTSKINGSIKINGVCPSRIRAEMFQDTSKFSVTFTATHVGHEIDDQFTQKQNAWFIEPYERILKKDKSTGGIKGSKLNLLSKQYLHRLANEKRRNKPDIKTDELDIQLPSSTECNIQDDVDLKISNSDATNENDITSMNTQIKQLCESIRSQCSEESDYDFVISSVGEIKTKLKETEDLAEPVADSEEGNCSKKLSYEFVINSLMEIKLKLKKSLEI